MRLTEIDKKARDLGINSVWKYSKKSLIREIQRAEGNTDCFFNPRRKSCDQLTCCWRSDCVK